MKIKCTVTDEDNNERPAYLIAVATTVDALTVVFIDDGRVKTFMGESRHRVEVVDEDYRS